MSKKIITTAPKTSELSLPRLQNLVNDKYQQVVLMSYYVFSRGIVNIKKFTQEVLPTFTEEDFRDLANEYVRYLCGETIETEEDIVGNNIDFSKLANRHTSQYALNKQNMQGSNSVGPQTQSLIDSKKQSGTKKQHSGMAGSKRPEGE